MSEFARAGVVTFGDDECKALRESGKAILEVISSFHDTPTHYSKVGPLADQKARELRAALFQAAPGLDALAERLRNALRGATAVLIPKVGLEAFAAGERATLAYSLAMSLGNPTAADSKQVIWDVKARQNESTYFSTFSETDGEAAYHTDTQYFPEPEASFILYCMEEARCGGGQSSILDARALRADIESSMPWVAETLASRTLPFRVPSAFVTGGDADTIEATLAPIFAKTPLIRYRRDTLAAGLLYFPEHADAAAHKALDAFEHELANSEHQADFFMPRDSLVLVDNHRALHARTAFQDHERHLLRIRIRDEGQATHASPLQLVRRQAQSLQGFR